MKSLPPRAGSGAAAGDPCRSRSGRPHLSSDRPLGSPPDRIVSAWIDDRLEIVASPKVIAELRRVAMRKKFRRWFDEAAAKQLVDRIELHATMHPDPPTLEGATPDPADDYLVALALATKADAVVSGDRHLHEADITALTPRQLADRLPS